MFLSSNCFPLFLNNSCLANLFFISPKSKTIKYSSTHYIRRSIMLLLSTYNLCTYMYIHVHNLCTYILHVYIIKRLECNSCYFSGFCNLHEVLDAFSGRFPRPLKVIPSRFWFIRQMKINVLFVSSLVYSKISVEFHRLSFLELCRLLPTVEPKFKVVFFLFKV